MTIVDLCIIITVFLGITQILIPFIFNLLSSKNTEDITYWWLFKRKKK